MIPYEFYHRMDWIGSVGKPQETEIDTDFLFNHFITLILSRYQNQICYNEVIF